MSINLLTKKLVRPQYTRSATLSAASHTFSVVERNINRNRSRICWVLVHKVVQHLVQVNQCHKPLLVLPDF